MTQKRYYIIANIFTDKLIGYIETNKKRQEANRKKIYGYSAYKVLTIIIKETK